MDRGTRRRPCALPWGFLSLLLFLPLPLLAEVPQGCHLTVYGAVMTDGALAETAVLTADLERDDRFVVVALGKRIGGWTGWLDLEVEGQLGKHLRGQHHWEVNALFIARWRRFPWNDRLRTSLAVGEGLSLASRTPAFEERYYGEQTSPLLNYLMLELAFSLPDHPRWSLVARIHHRSGIYGTFNGVHGASNALGMGLRYHF